MSKSKNIIFVILSMLLLSGSATYPMSYVKRWVTGPILKITSKAFAIFKRRPKTIIATAAAATGAFMLGRVIKTKNEHLVHALNNNQEFGSAILYNIFGATVPEDEQAPFVEQLVQAIRNQDYDTAQMYLESGIRIAKDQATLYADEFIEACAHKNDEQAKFWGFAGVSLEKQNERVTNALLHVLYFSHYASTLKMGKDGNPIFGENHHKSLEMVRSLIKLGANIDANNPEAAQIFHLVTFKGNKTIVLELINAGININIANFKGDTALHIAAHMGYTGIIQSLLQHKALINIQNKLGQSPLIRSIMADHLDTAGFLLRNHADVNIATNDGITPLMYAAMNGMVNFVVRLLACPTIDVHMQDAQGRTALEVASTEEIRDLLREYIQSNYLDDAQAPHGTTPLMRALIMNHRGLARNLCHLANNDLDDQDSFGCTALMRAIQRKNEPIALLLIEQGANVNIHDNVNMTALMYAAQYGLEHVVERLLGQHPEIDAQNDEGWTALMCATAANYPAIMQSLMASGAQKGTRIINGKVRP